MTSILSLVFSFVAAVVAVAAFIRTVFHELPTAEFLVTRDEAGTAFYRLSVSNPTRRLLVLNYIEVLSPSTATVFTSPERAIRGGLELAWEEVERAGGQTKSVFLAVPAGETKYLEIVFKK